MKPRCCFLAVLSILQGTAQAVEPDPATRLEELETKPIQEMSNVELGEYLTLRSSAPGPALEPFEQVGAFARRAVDQPFKMGAKQFSLADADCITWTERAIAAGLGSDWNDYYRLTQRLRHKDGVVQFLERNFFTPDWVTNNRWLLDDITAQVEQFEIYKHPIFRRDFYRNLQFGEDADSEYGRQKLAAKEAKIASVPEVELFRDSYIPRNRIPSAEPLLQTGDICLVIRSKPLPSGSVARFCDHMGIIERDNENIVYLLHCTKPQARRQRLDEFLRHYKLVIGFKFLRVRENAAQVVAEELSRFSETIPVPPPEQVDASVATTQPAPSPQ